MSREDTCSKCNLKKTERIMPASGICGTDGLDRINCWQECWECKALPICPKCIHRCKNCTGTYCQLCIQTHPYKPEFVDATCKQCKKRMTLETLRNVCGFEFKDDQNYWHNYKEDEFVCEICAYLPKS